MKEDRPGLKLEKIVARLQQMMEPNSVVTHNQFLVDRLGNKRQCDVVIKGRYAGHDILGLIECKDHNKKQGPATVEAFAIKSDNLGANFKIIVSKSGFTAQALKIAKDRNIGCLSLLPDDPAILGIKIGAYCYGLLKKWEDFVLTIHFTDHASVDIIGSAIDPYKVLWNEKPVANWFIKHLLTKHNENTVEGEHHLSLTFRKPRKLSINKMPVLVSGLTCSATRVYKKKRRWLSFSGDAFFDWHNNTIKVPPSNSIQTEPIETNLYLWEDYDGEIPTSNDKGPIRIIYTDSQKWDDSKDNEVPNLTIL